MLPDLPKLKADIESIFMRRFRMKVNGLMGIFGETPRQVIHEGNRAIIIREDGSTDEIVTNPASVELTIQCQDVPTLTIEDRLRQLDAMAEDMASHISSNLFKTLNETLEKAGQTVNHKGKPLNPEAVLDALSKTCLEFDQAGVHRDLSIVVGPELLPKAKEVWEQLRSDPVLRKKYEELMIRKWMEWRDKETSRKLVG